MGPAQTNASSDRLPPQWIRGLTTPAHRMDPRDPRRPGRAAQDHRRRGAGRAWPGRSALPATVTVERPRNPEHGDYATNLALQLAKKVGANPRELAGWLADGAGRGRRHRLGRRGRARLHQPAPRRPSAQGVIVNNVIDAGEDYGHSDALDRPEHQPRIRLGQPDRPDPHRRHPLGGRRRRAGPAAGDPGRRRRPRVLLQRPRRPDRPVRQLADRRRQGRTHPRRRVRGRLHQRHRRAGAGQGARRAEPARRARCARRSARSVST